MHGPSMLRSLPCFAIASTLTLTSAMCLLQSCASVPPPAPRAETLPRATGPDKAMMWRRLAWRDEFGLIDPAKVSRGMDQVQSLVTASTRRGDDGAFGGIASMDASWISRGPTNVGGRTRSLVIHPTQTNRMWAGSVGGGIFYSMDSGANWSAVNDRMGSLAIGSLAIHPTNPDVLFAGTGEGQFNGDALGGDGIFKSTDGGVSWAQLGSTNNWDTVNRIAISPSNPLIMLASKRWGGVMRSTDGGTSWSTAQWAQGSFDVQFHPTNGNLAVAHIIDYDTNWFHRALWSDDAGATWNTATGLDHQLGFGSRFDLCYAPSDPSIVYADAALGGGVIWKSTDGGKNYALVTTSGACGSSWYACPLWVHPTNPNFLLVGGYHAWKSVDGGVTLTQASSGYLLTDQVHPDVHGFVSDPGFNGTTNRRVYALSDGAMHVADDIEAAGTSSGWRSIVNGYSTTQFYGASGVELPLTPGSVVTGTSAGLAAKYFALIAPSALPNFATLSPYLTTSVTTLNYASTSSNFANSTRADNVGGLFTGWVTIDTPGLYTFSTESDDGSRLRINGVTIVDNDGLHGMQERRGIAALGAGSHAIEVQFFEAGGNAGLILRYEGPGIVRQFVPASKLRRGGVVSGVVPTTATASIILGGTQDNGTLRVLEGSTTANLPYGGDGGWCAVDWEDPRFQYGEYVNLKIHRSTDGGVSASNIYAGLTDAESGNANFIAPFILDPNDPKVLYGGGANLWRTRDARAAAVAWQQIRTGTNNVSAIAVSPIDPEIVWVAQGDGQLWTTANASSDTPTWSAIDDNATKNPLPNRYITRIVFAPGSSTTAYVCLGGFDGDNIRKTTNGGGLWTDVTGTGAAGLPSIPVRGMAIHPDDAQRLFVATEFGIFSSINGGSSWSGSDFGPANVSVDELIFLPNSRTLLAATHGRGMWTRDVRLPLGDLNLDGVVNAADLAIMLSQWGTAGDADLNHDGIVDAADLSMLLAAWST